MAPSVGTIKKKKLKSFGCSLVFETGNLVLIMLLTISLLMNLPLMEICAVLLAVCEISCVRQSSMKEHAISETRKEDGWMDKGK